MMAGMVVTTGSPEMGIEEALEEAAGVRRAFEGADAGDLVGVEGNYASALIGFGLASHGARCKEAAVSRGDLEGVKGIEPLG